jgi:hypothetical protein
MEQWEKEEAARKKLMQEIFEDQKRQIQEKCMRACGGREEESRVEREDEQRWRGKSRDGEG